MHFAIGFVVGAFLASVSIYVFSNKITAALSELKTASVAEVAKFKAEVLAEIAKLKPTI